MSYSSFIAGDDYQTVDEATLVFGFGISSASFPVTILSDNLTELTEHFKAVLSGVYVIDSGNILQTLSDQEHNRIQFSPVQAQVNIIDADGEFILRL